MKDLGFQGCCLRCDAEDVGGLSRCKSCIGYHKLVKTLLIDDGDSLLIQHMKDLYSMLSNPEMFDNDDIHGAELIYQQSLVSDVDFDGGYTYPDDIADLFNKESPVNRRIMQDLANKNPWKHKPPSTELAKIIGDETWSDEELADLEYDGKRTKPSKSITEISKEERVGEDLTIGLKSSDEGRIIVEKKIEKKRLWKDLVDDILDDL